MHRHKCHRLRPPGPHPHRLLPANWAPEFDRWALLFPPETPFPPLPPVKEKKLPNEGRASEICFLAWPLGLKEGPPPLGRGAWKASSPSPPPRCPSVIFNNKGIPGTILLISSRGGAVLSGEQRRQSRQHAPPGWRMMACKLQQSETVPGPGILNHSMYF